MVAPEKKNNNGLYLKGCFGCFVLVAAFLMFVSAVGGYLFYLEETGLDDHSDEILKVPVVNRMATPLMIKSDKKRARINLWVSGPGLTEAKGKVSCAKSVRQFGQRKHYRSKTDGPHKHIWLRGLRTYSTAAPKNCVVTFKTLKGTGPFEIIVTQSSRPSDWF